MLRTFQMTLVDIKNVGIISLKHVYGLEIVTYFETLTLEKNQRSVQFMRAS